MARSTPPTARNATVDTTTPASLTARLSRRLVAADAVAASSARTIHIVEPAVRQRVDDPLVAVGGACEIRDRDVLVVAMRDVDRSRPEQVRRAPRAAPGCPSRTRRPTSESRRRRRAASPGPSMPRSSSARPAIHRSTSCLHLVCRSDEPRHDARLRAGATTLSATPPVSAADVHRRLAEQLVAAAVRASRARRAGARALASRTGRGADTPSARPGPSCAR